jgi:SAM-dependent methyltransferase
MLLKLKFWIAFFARYLMSLTKKIWYKIIPGAVKSEDPAYWLNSISIRPFPVGDDPEFEYSSNQIPLPSPLLRKTVSRPDLGGFYFIGESWALAVTRLLAESDENQPLLLDIGCGVGKTARFLALDSRIQYVGFDIFKPAIEWCRLAFGEAIGPRMRFEHFDGKNKFYNPDGVVKPIDYEFPVEDGSVDVAFASSLFTHLYEEDMRAYLEQTARKLKPKGMALFSIHPLPDTAEQNITGTEQCIFMKPDFFVSEARKFGLHHTGQNQSICGQLSITFTLEQSS